MYKLTRPSHSSSQKTRLNDLSYGMKIWTDLYSVLSQSTPLTDRRTEGWTDRENSHRYTPYAFYAARKNRFTSKCLYETDSGPSQASSQVDQPLPASCL